MNPPMTNEGYDLSLLIPSPTPTPSQRKRRGLMKTPPEAEPRGRLTERDTDIVRAVYACRALTARQIEALFWGPLKPKANTRCQRRLRWLADLNYLDRQDQLRRKSDPEKPLVYFLGTRGKALLEELGYEHVDWKQDENDVRWNALEHRLASNSVRVAIILSAQRRGHRLLRWEDERTLKRLGERVTGRSGRSEALIPDGYFALQVGEETVHRFLETDLKSETGQAESRKSNHQDWASKVRRYLVWQKSGRFQARYGARSYRVLCVTTSEVRMRNLMRVTARHDGHRMFLFTTFERLLRGDPLSAEIWSRPGAADK